MAIFLEDIGYQRSSVEGVGKGIHQIPLVRVGLNGLTDQIPLEELRQKEEFHIPTIEGYQGLERVTTFGVNDSMVKALVVAAGGNSSDPYDLVTARQLLPLGFQSTNLYGIGQDWNTALYRKHTSTVLRVVGNGTVDTYLRVSGVRGNVLSTEYEQFYGGSTIAQGTDILFLDSYPWTPPPPSNGQRNGKRPAPSPPEENSYTDDLIICVPYLPQPEQVELYSELTGDHNKAHGEPGYMENTRFRVRSTIVHGQCVGAACVIKGMNELRRSGVDDELVALGYEWEKPVFTGKTLVIPFFRRVESEDGPTYRYDLTAIDQENTVLMRGWIELARR